MTLQDSLLIRTEIEDRAGQAESLRNLGTVCHQSGRLAKAKNYYVEAVAHFEAMKMPEADEVRETLSRVNSLLNDQGLTQSST